MSDLRALLLTDVVDSTKLSLRVGDAEMARLWAAHDRAARDLLPVWHGREIDKTDGMLLLFDAASDAVGYALAYQQALNQLAPRSRRAPVCMSAPSRCARTAPSDVALGAKPIEVEGVAKATAARVMSVGHGRADPAVGRCPAIAGRRRASAAIARTLAPQGPGRADRAVRDRCRRRAFLPATRRRQGLPCRAPGRTLVAGARDPAQPAGRRRRLRRPRRCAGRAVAPHPVRRAPGVGARHRRHRQDAPGDALRPELARRVPRRRLVLRSGKRAQRRRHRRARWRRGSTFRWAGTIRCCRSATPSPGAAHAW